MSSINHSSPSIPAPRTHEGAVALRVKPIQELRRTVLACLLWEDSFYESGESVAARIKGLVKTCVDSGHASEVAELAIEARSKFNLRHIPLFLVRELVRNKYNVETVLFQVIQRPDELTEFLAIYWAERTDPKVKKIASSVKRGLAKAFTKFNAYSLAKYNRDKEIKLRDVMFLTFPKPLDEDQAAVWKQLVDGTLVAPDTWEVALSAGADKQETWHRLIFENKLGALALLRNLRNMEEAKVRPDAIRHALDTCNTDRVLPFRFITAARYAPSYEPELERLMLRSLSDRPKLKGKTILLVDGSGSMFNAKISAKSELDRFDAATALAMLVREVCEQVEVIVFSNNSYLIPARRGFALRDIIKLSAEQQSTNTGFAKQKADERGYDRLIIITDEQSHQTISPPLERTKGYILNVAHYQNGIGYGPWTTISGWSEAVIDFIQTSEQEEEK